MEKLKLLLQYLPISTIISIIMFLIGGGGYFGLLKNKRRILNNEKKKLEDILGQISSMDRLIQLGNYQEYIDNGGYKTSYILSPNMEQQVNELTKSVGSIKKLSITTIDAYNCQEVLTDLKRKIEKEIDSIDKKMKSKNPF